MTGIIDSLVIDLARTMNVTSVVVTHDLKSAFRVADRMVVLNEGRIVAQGLPHEIRSSNDPFVKRFIHGAIESRTAVLPRKGTSFGIAPPGVHLVSSARNPATDPATKNAGPASAADTVTAFNLDRNDPVAVLPTATQDPISAQRIEAHERAAANSSNTAGQSLEALAPDEAGDELARELKLSHPAPFSALDSSQNTTGKFEMDTMRIPGMGGSLLEPALEPAPAIAPVAPVASAAPATPIPERAV